MSDIVDQLARLGQLRADGHLSEAEFEAEKAKILAGASDRARFNKTDSVNGGTSRAAGIGLVVTLILALGVGAYFLGQVDGSEDQRAQANAIADDGNMVASAEEVSRASNQPPQEFMNLCIYGVQAKLFRLPDALEAAGRQVSWQRNEGGWVLDAAWYDPVTKSDRSLSIALDRTESDIHPCGGNPGFVLISRVAIDGIEVPPQQTGLALFRWIGEIGNKDAAPEPERRAPISTSASDEPPAARSTMNGGDTYGREPGGAANPDGSLKSGGDYRQLEASQ